jgi:hypothetical protein
VLVADDGSRDATSAIARARGAEVIGDGRRRGKGGAASIVAARALEFGGPTAIYLFCDADLCASAGLLGGLVDRVAAGECDLAVARFERPVLAGFGLTVGFARWLLRRRGAGVLEAPLSGQRAMHGEMLTAVLPFARGFGMEVAMTLDVTRRGGRLTELTLPLEHRSAGRTRAGFAHRGRQFADILAVALRRR